MPVAATEMLSVPWGFRALNRIGAGLNRLGLAGVDLSPSRLILQAEQATGLRDFGPEDGWREGLERLVRAYEAEGGLSFVGRHGLHAELQRALQQRLLLLEQHRLHPEIGRITMDKPVFILGFPRTGTTVLHNLVALAPGLRAPRMWELLRPCPPPDPATEGTDPRVAALKAELAQVHRATPDLLRIHPLDPTGPDECFYLFAFSLHQRVADAQAPCPSFMRWVMEEDMRGAYQVHRKALQVLAWRYPPRRWALKAPTHLFHLDALLREYPDAVIVQTHRHPAEVAASCCSLYEATRQLFTERRDPLQIGQSWLETWAVAMERALVARQRAEAAGTRFIDLRFADFREDPAAQALGLLAALGEATAPDTEARMRAWLDAHKRDRHGDHRPTLERYGLSREAVSARFSGYITRFDL